MQKSKIKSQDDNIKFKKIFSSLLEKKDSFLDFDISFCILRFAF
jgi:hypothetical protein